MHITFKNLLIFTSIIIILFLFPGCEKDKSPTESGTDPLANSVMYETFLDRMVATNIYYYYQVDDLQKVGGYIWIGVSKSSHLNSILMEAFEKGKKIRVWLGEPYFDYSGSPGATARGAEMV